MFCLVGLAPQEGEIIKEEETYQPVSLNNQEKFLHRCSFENCQKAYKDRKSLQNHKKIHKLWECEICKRVLSVNNRKHRKTCREGPKPNNLKQLWPCSVCGQSFSVRSLLSNHLENVHGKPLDPPEQLPGATRSDHDYFQPETVVQLETGVVSVTCCLVSLFSLHLIFPGQPDVPRQPGPDPPAGRDVDLQ